MKKVEEIEINGERIYLRKNKYFGWKVIYPYKIDGKTNWFNLLTGGNWARFAITMGMVILLSLATYEYYSLWNVANECLKECSLYSFMYG